MKIFAIIVTMAFMMISTSVNADPVSKVQNWLIEEKNSIVLIDHTKSILLRKLMEDNIDKLGLKPIKTSGTLKSLRK